MEQHLYSELLTLSLVLRMSSIMKILRLVDFWSDASGYHIDSVILGTIELPHLHQVERES